MASKTFYDCGCMEQGDQTFYCDTHRNSAALSVSPPPSEPPAKFIEKICPFCGENDFDAWGLKFHLSQGGCDVYNETTREKRDGDR